MPFQANRELHPPSDGMPLNLLENCDQGISAKVSDWNHGIQVTGRNRDIPGKLAPVLSNIHSVRNVVWIMQRQFEKRIQYDCEGCLNRRGGTGETCRFERQHLCQHVLSDAKLPPSSK